VPAAAPTNAHTVPRQTDGFRIRHSLFAELIQTLLGDLSLDVLAVLLALETVILKDATVRAQRRG